MPAKCQFLSIYIFPKSFSFKFNRGTCVTMREKSWKSLSEISNVVDTFVRVLRVKTRKVDLRTVSHPWERERERQYKKKSFIYDEIVTSNRLNDRSKITHFVRKGAVTVCRGDDGYSIGSIEAIFFIVEYIHIKCKSKYINIYTYLCVCIYMYI